MINISRNWSKVIKIVGILLVLVPLLCSGIKVANLVEFRTEQNCKEIDRLTTVSLQFDERMDNIETSFEVFMKTTENNQKAIMKSLDDINNQLRELTKKAKW